MRLRGFYSDDPIDLIECPDCGELTQWLTLQDRPKRFDDWTMGSVPFKLPCCGFNVELFDDVIPLRGQPGVHHD